MPLSLTRPLPPLPPLPPFQYFFHEGGTSNGGNRIATILM